MSTEDLVVEVVNDRLEVTLNRPDKLNALTSEMFSGLQDCITQAAERDDVRFLILRGSGRAFCGGVDLSLVEQLHVAPRPVMRRIVRSWQRIFEELEDLEKATIAVFHDIAIGGGVELGLACDFRIAARNARISLPEARLGALPDGGVQRLVRMIGLGRAKDLVMTGRTILGLEAERMGLVSRVAELEELETCLEELLEELRQASPLGSGLAKRVLLRGDGTDLRTAAELELIATSSLYDNKDVGEAIQALKEKRKPVFRAE